MLKCFRDRLSQSLLPKRSGTTAKDVRAKTFLGRCRARVGLVCDAVPLVCSGSFTPARSASKGRRLYRRYVESLAVENPLRSDPSLARRAGVRAGVRRRFAGVQWFVYTSPQRKRGAAAVSTLRRDAW
ncbi:MAG: hypothetical protein QGG36_04030, partial [Pirellulaceae bacterium]|nr:hypothetical protein [Pirellulaceae bacterium]